MKSLVYKLPKFIRKRMRRVYVFYGRKKHLDKDVEVETDYGIFITNPMTYIGCSLYNRGIYEPDTTKIIKSFVEPGMTCIDIGASNGVHSLRMAKCVGDTGSVYAFEPSKERFDMLEKHIKLNNVKNIIAENKGVSDSHSFRNIEETGMVRMDEKKHEPVYNRAEVVTLDAFVKKNGLKSVDFIKIDTDGFEYKILKGGESILREFEPVMVVEMRSKFHGDKVIEDLVLYLSGLGYHFLREDTLEEYISEEALVDEILSEVKNVFCVVRK